jgi:hypothetical protein
MKMFHGVALAAVALALSTGAFAQGSKAVQLTEKQMAAVAGGVSMSVSNPAASPSNSAGGRSYNSDAYVYRSSQRTTVCVNCN